MNFNYEYEGVYVLAFVSFCTIVLFSLFNKRLNKDEVLEFVDEHIDDYEFRQDVSCLTNPRIGEIVENLSRPWYGTLGYVTKINDDDTYNIKVTKSLNPEYSRVPKRVITKYSEEVCLY
jgi:hypothetical protein